MASHVSFSSSNRRQWALAAGYSIVLLWINAYIVRDLFSFHTAPMNSMHGFWMALARRAEGSWFSPAWWPYWDCGIPFEATYTPLVPALTSLFHAIRSVPYDAAFGSVTALVYCLLPLTLFLMSWALTRSPGYSFGAALFYSLTSVTEILVPDGEFRLGKLWDARRLFVMSFWDDTPHLAALAFLPLAILFLALAIQKRRVIYYAAAATSIAIMTTASAFGPAIIVMSAVCLLFVLRREEWQRNVLLTAGIGAYGYLMAMAFVPPSLLLAIRETASVHEEEKWTAGSLTALALVVVGWTLLWHLIRHRVKDWRMQFFALLAYLMASVPMLAQYLNRRLLPQPGRYKFEMELALALVVAFGARPLLEKMPTAIRRAVILLLLALAVEATLAHRKMEKAYTIPQDVTKTVEYRAAVWADKNLAGTRALLPGSVGQWANAFADVEQFAGGSWSIATNRSQQNANAAILFGSGGTAEEDARLSLVWLKAFGVGAVGVSGRESKEFWKPFAHPEKFEGVLPALWSEDGVTIYRVPSRSPSLAHVVPEGAIVRHAPVDGKDSAEASRYVAALEDALLPTADFAWRGRNQIRIRTTASRGQAVSVQVGYHHGWHATVGGQARRVYKDGLGLMWLRPECAGPCEIAMDYDGGWELKLCRAVSYLAITGVLVVPVVLAVRRRRART